MVGTAPTQGHHHYDCRNGWGHGIAQAIWEVRSEEFDLMILMETNITDRGSSSHVKLNFKKYRLFVRLKFYHLKNIEQTDVDKSKRR